MKKKQILVTWDAYNNGFVVTAKVINMLLKEHKIKIDELLYLQNQNLTESNLAEIDIFFERKKYGDVLEKPLIKSNDILKKRVQECNRLKEDIQLEIKLPVLKNKRVNIKSVTNYQSIYDSLRYIVKEFYDNDDIDLHINVSPGTPQMHVVWLMMNTSGLFPFGTSLWSSQWDKKKEKTTLEKITFKPNSFLSEVLEKKHLGNHSPIINTNDTKSINRREAEEKLAIFSHIPNAPILLLGERGTGKSTYVRTIVKSIQGNNKPYSELACGTFSDELMRSELFGYKKGSFTGANKDKAGVLSKFKEGGLLFLDEIQDLSKELQRQLVQVLQTGEYYPLGAIEPEIATFRLITATNIKHNELLNKLDLDFLDRISRFIVEIPPLRECLEDLELYWKNVWNEVANFEAAPAMIWNKSIELYISTQELNGNFRDLQRLASYIVAFYYKTHKKEFAVKEAIIEFEKWNINNIQQGKESYFRLNSSYTEIVADFNRDLAEWAIKNYGNKKEASKGLSRSESMLSKDLRKERLKK